MPEYRLSRLARLDLIEIADYTVDFWGAEQAGRCFGSFEECFRQVARSPEIGRPCISVRPGYRRMELQKYVIFYRSDRDWIFISRILHQRMLPQLHLIDPSD